MSTSENNAAEYLKDLRRELIIEIKELKERLLEVNKELREISGGNGK